MRVRMEIQNCYSITPLFLLNFTTHYLLIQWNFTLQMIYSQLIYKKTPFIQEQTRQMVEFTLLCDMTTFCTSHSKCSCVCASTFTVASYILILNSKRKLVTEMPLKQKMRIHSCLFHIFQHLTLKMNQNIKISIMNLFVSNTSVLHST